MINVMVTASGSAIGQGIIKSLKASNIECRIITTDSQPNAAGLYRGNIGYIVPLAKESSFIEEIIKICKKEEVNIILIGTDYELLKFSENKEKIEKETGAIVAVSSVETITTAEDKWLTSEFLRKNGFPFAPSALPENYKEFVEKEGFPLIVKPRIGDSSKDTFLVHNMEELKRALEKAEDSNNEFLEGRSGFMIQKYLKGDEYTTSTFTIKGKCLGIISMKREMRYPGHTTNAVIDDFPEINSEIKKVAENLKAFGPCNFQSRIIEGKPVIFEINCRFSGTTATCTSAGFNAVDALINKVCLGKDVVLSYENGTMLRYFNEAFVPKSELDEIRKKGFVKDSKSRVNKL